MRTLVFFAVLLTAVTAQAQNRFIDWGACPGELCLYGKWRTEATTIAYARPTTKSRVVGKYLAGTDVEGLTGFVSLIPRRYLVKQRHEQYRPGDILWVYTYQGEGNFKVRFKGKRYVENLAFSPGGGGSGKRCEFGAECWGELDGDQQMIWWSKVKSADGWIGWTKEGRNFDHKR